MNDQFPPLLFSVNWPSSHSWDTAISKSYHENPWSRPCVWSKVEVMLAQQPIYLLHFCFTSIYGQGHDQGQNQWGSLVSGLHLRPSFQLIHSFSFCGNWIIYKIKIQGQGHGQDQTHWSHLRPRVQLICFLFISWQSDHFWLRHSKFHIWP